MKKITKTLIFLVILSWAQHQFLSHVKIKSDILGNIITFLSIIFGFYITSLAIFVTSKYVGRLYELTDQENRGQTLLNTLIGNYKFGLIFALITIAYLISIQIIVYQSASGEVYLSRFFLLPFLGFVIINFVYSYNMLQDLINVIIQEAKNNSKK